MLLEYLMLYTSLIYRISHIEFKTNFNLDFTGYIYLLVLNLKIQSLPDDTLSMQSQPEDN